MEQILDTIGEFIQGILDNPTVQLGGQLIAIYVVMLWLATALWAFKDMSRRTANPILPYLAAAFIVVFTPVFFIFAAIVYKIVRPGETIAEANERRWPKRICSSRSRPRRTEPTATGASSTTGSSARAAAIGCAASARAAASWSSSTGRSAPGAARTSSGPSSSVTRRRPGSRPGHGPSRRRRSTMPRP
jgi:hypothetical protein